METTAASIVLCLEAGLDEWHGSVHRLGIPPSFLPEPSSLDGSDHRDDAVQFNSIIRTASGGGAHPLDLPQSTMQPALEIVACVDVNIAKSPLGEGEHGKLQVTDL